MKNIIVSVTNDLSTDQRVHKVCSTLQQSGFNVLLVGRRKSDSLALSKRAYATQRMLLLFERGPLFYAEYHFRLFLLLLFKKNEILLSNDLDTLLPNYLISKLKKTVLVYDSHELFCEVPELQSSPFKKSIWKNIERFIFPRLNHVFTVNESIAQQYRDEYNVPITVLLNAPTLKRETVAPIERSALAIPADKKIILLQGAGINMHRGAEEAIQAMQYINNAVLLIVGAGDVLPTLKKTSKTLELEGKVVFVSKVPFEQLGAYTRLADIGLSLDKGSNINYRFSLPNKLFDYLHAGVPILASDLPEVKKIVLNLNIGAIIENHQPKHIANKLNTILNDEKMLTTWKRNASEAAKTINWENEEKKLMSVFKSFLA